MTELVHPLLDLFKKSMKHGRLAHAYLFEGAKGTGKHQVSLWLAKRLFCTNLIDEAPCQQCINCQRIEHLEHPNVHVVQPDGQMIRVDQIRQLQAEFAKRGFESGRQVFILSQADKMNTQAANSLLKFLEEPSGEVLMILETQSLGSILPTIQSRCQIVHFPPIATKDLYEQLLQANIYPQTAKLLTFMTNSYDKAVEISQNEWFNDAKEEINKWFDYLKNDDFMAFIFVQRRLVPLAKDKNQQIQLLDMLMFYYREFLQTQLMQVKKVQAINQALAAILNAQRKLQANVAFQAVAEQLVLHLLKKQ
ncbi:DNA polymerase III subunit delta' [Enterococcus columbae]|uniref:DNA polymerase III, delta' subunit n=1 Tax=Enterococcus columbae DSM 7374 = ATCC 51263 TaxID=1121865 RepID=S1MVD7_9ENTE|nr:DNA polymerase III subunit delta' [Enterococcus columbae]EOT41865.1 DNA polymerase III, delta' subunit [Enterococcus columbae DSM 7374 = ATCC 51263]EOW80660.1 DNA polymerase III, delta' subunit [Enterococcus columbae DSM 7374 = ATCC 51263]OJG26257.1 DNA polymerase III, delta subunit [Enterococcus columbae DSM 7374 = ATCC 51263]